MHNKTKRYRHDCDNYDHFRIITQILTSTNLPYFLFFHSIIHTHEQWAMISEIKWIRNAIIFVLPWNSNENACSRYVWTLYAYFTLQSLQVFFLIRLVFCINDEKRSVDVNAVLFPVVVSSVLQQGRVKSIRFRVCHSNSNTVEGLSAQTCTSSVKLRTTRLKAQLWKTIASNHKIHSAWAHKEKS